MSGYTRREVGYAFIVAAAAAVLALATNGPPRNEPLYVLLAAGLAVGGLLTVRPRAGRPSSSLVIVPAVVAQGWLGLVMLAPVLYAGVATRLVRRLPVTTAVVLASHECLAFALAGATSHLATSEGPARLVVFALVFALAPVPLAGIAERYGVTLARERTDLIFALMVAPVAALPLVAGRVLGVGALLLTLAGVLVLLLIMREAVNLATARSEVESERERLARANALQDDLLQLMTHEIKNPLTLVLGYAKLLRNALDAGAADAALSHVARVERAGRSIQRLVDNLLHFSRMETGDELPPTSSAPAACLVREVVDELAPLAAAKDHVLAADVAHEGLDVLVVPELAVDALRNLVSNAIKYTPRGGTVTVRAERQPDQVVLAVTDNGIGITLEEQARLFSRFFRSRDVRARKESGSGLGLALSRAMARRMGGDISVESVPGRGTTFRLMLPHAAGTEGEPPNAD